MGVKSSYSNCWRREFGFTLIELIMVIVVIGILSSVAVPKFINLTGDANDAKCDSERSQLMSAVAIHYADTLIRNPAAGDWMANATMADVEAAWFATGVLPACPIGGTYTLAFGRVSCSVHAS